MTRRNNQHQTNVSVVSCQVVLLFSLPSVVAAKNAHRVVIGVKTGLNQTRQVKLLRESWFLYYLGKSPTSRRACFASTMPQTEFPNTGKVVFLRADSTVLVLPLCYFETWLQAYYGLPAFRWLRVRPKKNQKFVSLKEKASNFPHVEASDMSHCKFQFLSDKVRPRLSGLLCQIMSV